ncbi:hypothetical protein LFT44_21940 (plasmid) [Arthrobacter sp. FW306-05-C]|uniref:hypothetical protein n=1 Tax=Arthrobacter sp. FW306-05-C TaxID=2879620 RepID=UPI001F38799B|nr:hypothetical protein [Arthrobacter sp. FW306-05-C]UKA69189.1 hypothetical protein LFT44_21940 [Arthrobacter sp. FW306-05-C]
MTASEADVWASQLLGPIGPQVREQLPGILIDTHNKCVALQTGSELSTAHAYGLMWVALPNDVARKLSKLEGADVFRPRNGKYPVVAFNGVPVLPWRVSKELVSQLEHTVLAEPVKGTKRALFERRAVQTMFDFSPREGSPDMSEMPAPGDEPDLREMIQELVGDEAHVALLAYSSNQHALISAHFGYAKLGENDVIEITYSEKIDLDGAAAQRLRVVPDLDAVDSFDAGEVEALVLRPRTSLEGTPSAERPVELPNTAEQEND